MRFPRTLIALPIALAAACGDNSSPSGGGGSGGSAPAHAGSTSAGAPSSVAGASSAGASSGSTASGSGGAAAGAGAAAAGSSSTAGQSSATAGSGGTLGAAGAAGAAGTAGAGGGTAGCTRQLLKSTIDAYFKALAAHDASTLPLADNLKFTENGKASKPAEAALWKTAGALKYAHSALDTDTCMSATEAVVPDGTTDVPIALRLKLQNQKLTEIETIVVRKGDYSVASNTAALIASNDTVKWEETVPTDKRNTRAEVTGWMEKYYKQFPNGVCNTTTTCKRIENGGGSFNCSEGAGCTAGSGTGQALKARLVFADVESGLGVGFTLFTGGYTDMHLFKMSGGQVYGVSAILAKADSSGWD